MSSTNIATKTPKLSNSPAPITVVVQAIADPGPLGLAAFALTTFMLSAFNAGFIDPKLEAVVLPVALFYGGIAQLLAGMWEFRIGNTFGALAFSSYGAFWLSFAGYVKFVAGGLPAGEAYQATGLFLLAWTIFTLYMTVVSSRVSRALFVVFLLLSLAFISLTIGALGQSPSWTKIGGWLGLITALGAWYASFAGVANATWKRIVLPTWPVKN